MSSLLGGPLSAPGSPRAFEETLNPDSGPSTFATTNPITLDSSKELRTRVEEQLQYTAQLLYNMEITAGYVVEERQDFMESSVNQLIRSYETLSGLASNMTDTVPTETLVMIDEGINPHEYTKKTLNGTLTSSQWANGKVRAFESYRQLLSSMIFESFPEMEDPTLNRESDAAIAPPSVELPPTSEAEDLDGTRRTGEEDGKVEPAGEDVDMQ